MEAYYVSPIEIDIFLIDSKVILRSTALPISFAKWNVLCNDEMSRKCINVNVTRLKLFFNWPINSSYEVA